MGKCCLHASSFIFDRIIIKVAGNQDRHKSSHEFDFGPDWTTHFGVTCPWMTKILHFRTWISLRPVGQYWSNFMCSITGGGERLHNILRQIGSKLWCPWQQKAPIDLQWGKWCLHLFSVAFDSILFILAGNEGMHKISDKFELRPDRTTDYRVSCPWASKKFPIDLEWENAVSILTRSFLIESSSKLLITRTGIKARLSLILGCIRPLILELLALEWRKFYTFELEYLWSRLAYVDQILCVASLGWGERLHKGQIGSKLWFPWQQKAPIDLLWENDVSTFSWLFFIRSFLYLQVMKECIKSRTSSNFGQIGPLTTELAALERLKNFP